MRKKIVIQGINYDSNSSFMRGPAKAPDIIRQAFYSDSINAYTELGINVTQSEQLEFKDPIKPTDFYSDIFQSVDNIISDGKSLITLGGDHSISYPIIAAHAEHFDNINILQIDAHSDLYEDFEGNLHSHASPFARIMENKLAARLIQVGIRCLTPHQLEQSVKYGVEVVEMKDFHESKLPDLDGPLYISLDLDGLDPAFAPGVSHHEPGGLTTREVLSIIHNIDVPVIGADIVEYNPIRDHVGITAAVAAKFLKEIAGKMIKN
tara:strand:- start:997 stop:1788 length:792 start_codon:yes stop_codon:yes gene_type:complete